MPRPPIAIPAACCLAVAAFAVAMVVGVLSENSLSGILERALIALVIFWPIGFALGRIVEWIVMHKPQESASEAPQVPLRTEDATQEPGGVELDVRPDESDGQGAQPRHGEGQTVASTPS